MWTQDLPLEPTTAVPAEPRSTRATTAALLRAASRLLDALAERLAQVEAPAASAASAALAALAATEPVIEFHGDAAAPEGALYVNGQFIGRLFGVRRL